jgi:hypothetical protein
MRHGHGRKFDLSIGDCHSAPFSVYLRTSNEDSSKFGQYFDFCYRGRNKDLTFQKAGTLEATEISRIRLRLFGS